jgi:hypothetical protein
LGVPQLMMGFTQPGQAKAALVGGIEKEVSYSVEERMKARQDIAAAPVLPGANSWEQGNVYQIKG